MKYLLETNPLIGVVSVWDSETLEFCKSITTGDIVLKLIENEHSFGNAELCDAGEILSFKRYDLTNEMIYGKIHDNIVTYGDISLRLIGDDWLVLENHLGRFICHYYDEVKYYLPVVKGNVMRVYKNGTMVQQFTKTNLTLTQLRKFSVLGDCERVYNEYKESVNNFQVFTNFAVSKDTKLLNDGKEVIF